MTKFSSDPSDTKMMKLRDGEWVDYGKVSVNIIEPHNAANYVAIRQVGTYKDLSKHLLTTGLQLRFHRHCDRSVIWRVQDLVNGGTKIEDSTILIKFKSSELAQEFQSKFELHQE